MQNLIIFSHSFFEQSRVNKALLKAAASHAEIRNLEELYQKGKKDFDVSLEQDFLKKPKISSFNFRFFGSTVRLYLKAIWTLFFCQICLKTRHLWARNSPLPSPQAAPTQAIKKMAQMAILSKKSLIIFAQCAFI